LAGVGAWTLVCEAPPRRLTTYFSASVFALRIDASLAALAGIERGRLEELAPAPGDAQ